MKRTLIKDAGLTLAGCCAIGTIHKIVHTQNFSAKESISEKQINDELQKFEKSVAEANQEIDKTLSHISDNSDKNFNNIVSVHKSILNDPEIKKDVIHLIQVKLHSMEAAINKKFLQIEKQFTSIKDPYLKERINDYKFVKNSLINKLDSSKLQKISAPTILVLEDISPGQVINFHKNKNIVAICLKYGSRTSHASIILKSLNIPSIIQLEQKCDKLPEGETIIIDALDNLLILNPDEKDLQSCQEKIATQKTKEQTLRKLIDKPSTTKSGKLIKIRANIEFEEEIEIALRNGAHGVGLLRTEMFYLEKKSLPSRKQQFDYYKKIVTQFKDSITIRTLDFGGDKSFGSLESIKEENPNLGLRGIRFSLKNPKILATQLEAILMASAYGKIKILLPMVSQIQEVEQTKKILANCKKRLDEENLPYDKNIKLGIMIEVPSVVFQIEEFAKICDFFSIGTNDLTQYIIAIDRGNEQINQYYDECDPSVLQALKIVLKETTKRNIPTALCGEIASNPEKIDRFLDLGIDELSVNTSSILTIKQKAINHE